MLKYQILSFPAITSLPVTFKTHYLCKSSKLTSPNTSSTPLPHKWQLNCFLTLCPTLPHWQRIKLGPI